MTNSEFIPVPGKKYRHEGVVFSVDEKGKIVEHVPRINELQAQPEQKFLSPGTGTNKFEMSLKIKTSSSSGEVHPAILGIASLASTLNSAGSQPQTENYNTSQGSWSDDEEIEDISGSTMISSSEPDSFATQETVVLPQVPDDDQGSNSDSDPDPGSNVKYERPPLRKPLSSGLMFSMAFVATTSVLGIPAAAVMNYGDQAAEACGHAPYLFNLSCYTNEYSEKLLSYLPFISNDTMAAK
ncbi:MAG: hypothetical protein JWN28_615 [Candidatus Saccharibacteria bacterium]|nr:hypothetical protein [Candidatus Saccharibacteria bacterium]